MDDDDEGPPRLPGGKFYMTPEGRNRLAAEFEAVRSERHRVVEIVSWAAGNGDRSENADYKEGKRRLREIDRRLRFLIGRLAHAEPDPARLSAEGIAATWSLRRGKPASAILAGASREDLIVLSTHRRLGLDASLEGCVAFGVAGKWSGNMLLVPVPRQG